MDVRFDVVDRAEVVADYVITDGVMDHLHARLSPEELEDVRRRFPPSYLRAEAESISSLLEMLDEEYGSAEAWLRGPGVTRESIDRLRSVMLD